MSNIIVTNCSLPLVFLGNYVIENVEMISGNEFSGKMRIGVLIDNERYEMRVEMKEGKKVGNGLIVREDGTLFM